MEMCLKILIFWLQKQTFQVSRLLVMFSFRWWQVESPVLRLNQSCLGGSVICGSFVQLITGEMLSHNKQTLNPFPLYLPHFWAAGIATRNTCVAAEPKNPSV